MSDVRHLSVSLKSVLLWSLAIYGVCLALAVVPFVRDHGRRALHLGVLQWLSLGLLCYLHELVHVFGFRVAGGLSRGQVAIRLSLRYLMPHVRPLVPVTVRRYRLAALLPGLLLGIAPLAAGLLLANGTLVAIGVFMTSAAGGDVAVVARLHGLPATATVEFSAAWGR